MHFAILLCTYLILLQVLLYTSVFFGRNALDPGTRKQLILTTKLNRLLFKDIY